MAKWFYTGNVMADGTPRTSKAEDELAVAECLKKGWKEVGEDEIPLKPVSGKKVDGVTGAATAKKGNAHDVFGKEITKDAVEDVIEKLKNSSKKEKGKGK